MLLLFASRLVSLPVCRLASLWAIFSLPASRAHLIAILLRLYRCAHSTRGKTLVWLTCCLILSSIDFIWSGWRWFPVGIVSNYASTTTIWKWQIHSIYKVTFSIGLSFLIGGREDPSCAPSTFSVFYPNPEELCYL